VQVVVDCADPVRLGAFWRAVLHYGERPPPSGHDSWAAHQAAAGPSDYWIDDPGGARPTILFQPVPEGKVVKNRVHLDVRVSGGPDTPPEEGKARIDAAVPPTLALGATYLRTSENPDDYFVVLQDPEGNEFCLI
jgi:hypothetical protein